MIKSWTTNVYCALSICIVTCGLSRINAQEVLYVMPVEDYTHEGTWIEWPHHYTYGYYYRNSIESTWIDMTASLIDSEKVHIIVYDESEYDRVYSILLDEGIPLDNIDFYIHPFDDVWIRDNGPIFVLDEVNNLFALDWGFNGWGFDYPYELDDEIPSLTASSIDVPSIDLNAMVLEGGAIEVDGLGTAMATKSSIAHSSRNPNLSEQEIEEYLTTYMGISHLIWLEGVYGLEVTDMHIDGFVKFLDSQTIVTMSSDDLEYWGVPSDDITLIFEATNALGVEFDHILLPLTQSNVSNTFGDNLGYKGSYVNYYVANSVVLVPNYNDPNDAIANEILAELYPNKTVVGIDVRNLYENGGMIHCVTQQQPFSASFNGTHFTERFDDTKFILYPNPANDHIRIMNHSKDIERIELYNMMGQLEYSAISISSDDDCFFDLPETLSGGIYQIQVYSKSEKMVTSLVISR
jgi:agmatine deiminase